MGKLTAISMIAIVAITAALVVTNAVLPTVNDGSEVLVFKRNLAGDGSATNGKASGPSEAFYGRGAQADSERIDRLLAKAMKVVDVGIDSMMKADGS